MQVVCLAVHLLEASAEVGANFRKNTLEKFPDTSRDGLATIFGNKDQVVI
jgi:hypothetical protein